MWGGFRGEKVEKPIIISNTVRTFHGLLCKQQQEKVEDKQRELQNSQTSGFPVGKMKENWKRRKGKRHAWTSHRFIDGKIVPFDAEERLHSTREMSNGGKVQVEQILYACQRILTNERMKTWDKGAAQSEQFPRAKETSGRVKQKELQNAQSAVLTMRLDTAILRACQFTGNVHCLSARQTPFVFPDAILWVGQLINTAKTFSLSKFSTFLSIKVGFVSFRTLFVSPLTTRLSFCLPLATINNCPLFLCVQTLFDTSIWRHFLHAKVVGPKNADRHRSISALTFGLVPKVQQNKQKWKF